MRKPTKPNPRSITNDKDDNVHPEDWKMHRECIDWLGAKGTAWRSGRESSPWFLYCSLNIPHPPFNTNLTWLQSVDQPAVRAHPPRWSNTSSLHPHDEYMTISKAVDGPFSDEAVFLVRRTYYAMVAETDYLMGQVLDAARASGMYDETLVVFLSDHGEMNMEHRQVWKNAHYEASARVPLIISGGAHVGAGLPRGTLVTNLTSLLDVYPTLLSMGRLQQPAAGMLAGASLSPFLGLADAAALPPRKPYVVSQYHSNMGNTGAFCIVHGRYKYIAFGHGFNATYGGYAAQLFDVVADPEELNDLARAKPELIDSLDALLRSELASGFNALSQTGDYREIDVHVKTQQQTLYRRFFLNASRLQRQYERLCVPARLELSVHGRCAPLRPRQRARETGGELCVVACPRARTHAPPRDCARHSSREGAARPQARV